MKDWFIPAYDQHFCFQIHTNLSTLSRDFEDATSVINLLRAADFSTHLSRATEAFSQNN